MSTANTATDKVSHNATNNALLSSSFASQDNFQKFIIVSLSLHVALLFGFELKNLVFPSETFVVPESIRVDVVALPDKLPEKIETPAPPEPPKPAPPAPKVEETPKVKPPPPKPVAKVEPKKDIKDLEKKAIEKMSAMDSIQKMQNELDAAQKKKAEAEKKPPAPVFKGNIISSGSSFNGLSKLRVNSYIEDLKSKVHDHWVLPQYLSDANLKAQVLMVIAENGMISRKEISVSSGNSTFDASCLAAVTNAAPFLAPPPELKDATLSIRFPFE